jgi:hypothetical protein
MLSLLIQHKKIYFVDPVQFKDLLPPKQFKSNKRVIASDTPLIISSI